MPEESVAPPAERAETDRRAEDRLIEGGPHAEVMARTDVCMSIAAKPGAGELIELQEIGAAEQLFSQDECLPKAQVIICGGNQAACAFLEISGETRRWARQLTVWVCYLMTKGYWSARALLLRAPARRRSFMKKG